MAGPNGFLENAVLGIVHMHVLRGVKDGLTDLIMENFKEDDVRGCIFFQIFELFSTRTFYP
jgi:hypothetical protein